MTHLCSPSGRNSDEVHAPHHRRGGDEREREGLKVGRSERFRTKVEAAALLLTPPTPEGRDSPSLRPKPHPKKACPRATEQRYDRSGPWAEGLGLLGLSDVLGLVELASP